MQLGARNWSAVAVGRAANCASECHSSPLPRSGRKARPRPRSAAIILACSVQCGGGYLASVTIVPVLGRLHRGEQSTSSPRGKHTVESAAADLRLLFILRRSVSVSVATPREACSPVALRSGRKLVGLVAKRPELVCVEGSLLLEAQRCLNGGGLIPIGPKGPEWSQRNRRQHRRRACS